MRSVSEVYVPQGAHQIIDADPSEHYEKWGYSIGYEKNASGRDVPIGGNTAVFNIQPRGMTEPVFVTKPEEGAEFRVNVVEGLGFLLRASTDDRIILIERLPLQPGNEIIIKPGEAYTYINPSHDDDLVLRDVAVPAFNTGDDEDLTVSRVPDVEVGMPDLIGYSACSLVNSRKMIYLPNCFYDAVGQNLLN